MARIAFLLLCHKDVDGVVALARALTAAGDFVAIHYDGAAPAAGYDRLRAALQGDSSVTFARRRIRCGWGEWSLVEASLQALRAARRAFAEATHFYLISGDCRPVKSSEYARAMLDAAPADYIESVDFFRSGWIRTGMREERLIYRHLFNERRHKWLFYASLEAQKRLGLKCALPSGIEVMIGSQWWCLRRGTVDRLLAFCAERPDMVRFFRRTWIPDETFFQTLVRHLVPEDEIRCRPPTFLVFSDYGMPAVFYDDHYDFLLAQDALFARKISPDARGLKARLEGLWATQGARFRVTGDGRAVHAFVTGQGRHGKRFAPRFWEGDATLGRQRALMIVIARDRAAGVRLAAGLGQAVGVPALGYVFDDAQAALPDLGGIERTLDKRSRHRRVLMRMLFDHLRSDQLLICVDPANLEVLRDFEGDRAVVRFLHLAQPVTDDDLAALARRRGLDPEGAAGAAVLPALRSAARDEDERLPEAGFAHFTRLDPDDPAPARAAAVAAFLGLPAAQAATILAGLALPQTAPRTTDPMNEVPDDLRL